MAKPQTIIVRTLTLPTLLEVMREFQGAAHCMASARLGRPPDHLEFAAQLSLISRAVLREIEESAQIEACLASYDAQCGNIL